MKVSGFNVSFIGDESVGIFSTSWEVKNEFIFEDEDELEDFRRGLENLFGEYCMGAVQVLTFEEIAEIEKLFNDCI